MLKLVAASLAAFERLLDALHGTAAGERVGRVAIRCQTEYADAYLRLVAAGLPGALDRSADDPARVSQPPPRQGIVLSNWEI